MVFTLSDDERHGESIRVSKNMGPFLSAVGESEYKELGKQERMSDGGGTAVSISYTSQACQFRRVVRLLDELVLWGE